MFFSTWKIVLDKEDKLAMQASHDQNWTNVFQFPHKIVFIELTKQNRYLNSLLTKCYRLILDGQLTKVLKLFIMNNKKTKFVDLEIEEWKLQI